LSINSKNCQKVVKNVKKLGKSWQKVGKKLTKVGKKTKNGKCDRFESFDKLNIFSEKVA
jgi:hypothetical protein